MTMPITPIAVISGPVGVGKTSVAEKLSEVLAERQTPHTFIDFDQLRYTYPRPAGDRCGNTLGLKNLTDVWSNCSQAGAKNLIIANVIEDNSFLDDLRRAIAGASITTIQLSADVAVLEARVRTREIGSGLDWHIKRSAELAEILTGSGVPCDFRITTDGRSVSAIASEIAGLVDWCE